MVSYDVASNVCQALPARAVPLQPAGAASVGVALAAPADSGQAHITPYVIDVHFEPSSIELNGTL